MNLYRISQSTNNDYDTFDSAVVCAESEDEARMTLPADYMQWGDASVERSWTSDPKDVTVLYLGELDNEQIDWRVICASFNAG